MHKSKCQTAAIAAYAVVSVLFIIFFVYMGLFENISVQSTRDTGACRVVEHTSSEEIEDPSAPIGIRKEYRWTLHDIDTNDTSLNFYLVHHYAEVYFDGELVYRLMPREDNLIGKSISSNWVTIPVYPSDNGKEVRVLVTPVYESVRDREIEFQVAPFHSLYLTQLKKCLPQLALSMICFVLGLIVMLVELVLIWRRRTQRWDIFYLGNFIMILGVWKITDTRFSPFIFEGNPLLLGYLTIGALFLACIPLALYLHGHSPESRPALMPVVSLIASGTALIALFCQIFGIADFRQTLPLAHIVIILAILSLFVTMLIQKVRGRAAQSKASWGLVLLLVCGALADVFMFYISGSSSGLIFTLLAILLYTLALFVLNLMDINKRAYTDILTGLFNKSRWDVLMNDPILISEPICMMMLDLNGLKHTNDTLGHEAGDKMIFNFANVLRNTIPPTSTICRWGGDEFTVMLTHADRETAEKYMRDIRSAVDAYNASGETPALYYAAGYALSTEFPGLSHKELLEKADERMYLDKQQWYALHDLH